MKIGQYLAKIWRRV